MKFKALVLGTIFALSAGAVMAQYHHDGPPQTNNTNNDNDWRYDHGRSGNWDSSWDRRAEPRRGACFFTDANFSGRRFCVRSGDRVATLPAGYGNSISSIRTFGGASVHAFGQRDFRGRSIWVHNESDLGYSSKGPNRGWNDRISSVVVR